MWKTCMVPYCTNNTTRTPEKLFIRVPNTFEVRKAWFDAVNRNVNEIKLLTSSFCCEDHFQLPEDAENWQEHLQYKRSIKIKKNIIPRISKHKRSFEYVEENDEEGTNKKKLKVQFKNKFKTDIDVAFRSDTEASTSFKISPVQVRVLEENTEMNISPQNIKYEPNLSDTCDKGEQYGEEIYRSEAVQVICDCDKGEQCGEEIYRSKVSNKIETKATQINSTPNISSTKKGTITSTSTNSSTFSPCFLVSQTNISETMSTTSYTNSAELQNSSLERTLSIIKERPCYYIGIPKDHYYIVDIITTKINVAHHHVLLCLKKIRRNTPFSELADDFDVSESYASEIFSKTIPLIYCALKAFIFWPEEHFIKRNLPVCFRYRYYDVQSIFDCLEIQIENPEKERLTWSQYNGCDTLKYLVSMTPDGFCNFLSDGYGGTITDQHLIEDSNFLNMLPVNCTVMGDRRFKHIDRLLLDRGCKLIHPPSVAVKDKKSDKVIESKEIIALRIHVERLFRRFREFLFLSPHAIIDHNLISLTDEIIKIVAALINIQNKI